MALDALALPLGRGDAAATRGLPRTTSIQEVISPLATTSGQASIAAILSVGKSSSSSG